MSARPKLRRRETFNGTDDLPAQWHPVIQRVLRNRGVRRESDLSFGLEHIKPAPEGEVFAAALDLLVMALEQDWSIIVVGDFDADGATSTALLLRVLCEMGALKVSYRVPDRFKFGYGLSADLVADLLDEKPDLLITVDNGISSVDGVALAQQNGIRVLITDHHLPGTAIPKADAIVNPNFGDSWPDGKCLAGVGVVFFLLVALRKVLVSNGWFAARDIPPVKLAQHLDLVALGTVADLVPLDRNNQILVKQGVNRIRAGNGQAGIRALLRVGKRRVKQCVSTDLGFCVAPRLNAAGRLDDMSLGISCLLAANDSEAAEYAAELDELNKLRRNVQAEMEDMARSIYKGLLKKSSLSEVAGGLVLFDESWHQGVVGLVASRMADQVNRPCIAFAPSEPGSPVLKASARSIKGVHIRDILANVDAQKPGLIERFGGHAMAAGLTLQRDSLAEFRSTFDALCIDALDGIAREKEVWTDGPLDHADMNLDLAAALAQLLPWGQALPSPTFDGLFEIVDRRLVGGAHMKLMVTPPGLNKRIDAICFYTRPEDVPPGRATVRLVYQLSTNEFRGVRSLQLIVEHIL